ncbi:hypothetical protein [Leifsonia sp. AG29]|uniref:hypothetical protein n=1 Tax=Leifsonia sp. AG29 TaxID=2598860 RepID=UPI00131C1999|nr:hypothetical protein [Leifsonia sp. AG29]
MKRPSQRTWIIAGLSAAAVIAIGAFALSQVPVGSTAQVAAGSSRPTHSSSPSSAAGQAGGSDPGGQSGSGEQKGGSAPATPPAATKRYTTEVIPAGPATAPALPPSTALPHPIAPPLPKSASAVGKLVTGYPAAVLPQAPGSAVQTSSVAAQGDRLQVTLTATSTQGVTDVLAFYRSALAKYGMYDTAAPALSGATSLLFSRGSDSVTLTASTGKSGTTYTLYAAFTAQG